MLGEFVADLVECSDAELAARIEANQLQRRTLDAEMSALLAVADSRSLHQVSGHRTMTSWCRSRLNWSTTEANRRRAWARAPDAIPGMGDAWMDGRFGQPQAAKLAATHANPRVRDRVGEFAPPLLEHAEQMPYADFNDVVEHFVACADEDGALGGHVRRVVFDSDRVVIDMGRRQRLFSGSPRQAARQLIPPCERSGCELRVDWCDVDHVEEWDRESGRTDQANAAILCRHDNNDKHRRRWRTRRGADGCRYTIGADGVVEMPVGARAPRFSDESDDDGEDDSPAEVARLTAFARDRVAQLCRND